MKTKIRCAGRNADEICCKRYVVPGFKVSATSVNRCVCVIRSALCHTRMCAHTCARAHTHTRTHEHTHANRERERKRERVVVVVVVFWGEGDGLLSSAVELLEA